MNLYQKIVEVRKSIGTLSKDRQGYNFSYVTGDQILGKIKGKMNDLGLILQVSTKPGNWEKHNYITSSGKDKLDFLVWGEASYTWINADNPEEREVIDFAYYGQQGDDLSQAYGTALTYTERYFLLKFFGVPTDGDDPDYRRHGNKNDPPSQTKNTNNNTQTVVTVKQLTDLANKKRVPLQQLIDKYKADTGKSINDIKYLKAEYKKTYYDMLSGMPDKE